MENQFLGQLKRSLQYAIPWLPKGAIHPNKIEPSDTTGKVLTTTSNGSEWRVTGAHYERAAPTSTLTLGTAAANLPGANFTVDSGKGGTYLVTAVFDFSVSAAGVGIMVGDLAIDGVVQGEVAVLHDLGVNTRATVTQTWVEALPDGAVVTLRAYKTSAGGTATASAGHSNITAIRLSD